MDALDMRILRTLGIAPYVHGSREGLAAVRPATVARKLGIHLELAKDRMQRMESSGVIQAYDVHPNPRLFGLQNVTLHMEVGEAAKAHLREVAQKVPGVIGVYDFIGGHLCVEACSRDPPGAVEVAAALADLGGLDRPPAAYFQRTLPPPPRPLGRLDARILIALRRRARRPLPEVGEEVGISARTVKRHLDRMAREGQFDAYVDVGWARMEGVLAFDLGLRVAAEHAAATLAAARCAFDSHSLADWRPPSPAFPGVMFALWARTASEVEALRRQAEALPHVQGATAIVAADAWYDASWVDRALHEVAEGDAPVSSV